MKFKNFLLNEDNRSKTISEETAFELLKSKCNNALEAYNEGSVIYRGVDNNSDFIRVDPKSGSPRKSSEGLNYYTLLIDNLPGWKSYPKRSESLICTNRHAQSAGYGNTFVVFPFDGAKLGICPKNDIWYSFSNSNILSMKKFGEELRNLLLLAVSNMRMKQKKFDKDWKTLERHLFTLDKAILMYQLDFKEYQKSAKETWVKRLLEESLKGKKVIDILNNILDPKRNGFKLKNINNYETEIHATEIWTDSESIMVNYNNGIEKIKKEGIIY